MGRANKTGRSKRDMGNFTPLLHHLMDSAAWRSLPPLARCLYTELDRRAGYKGARNGKVFMSVREVAEEFGVNKDTASRAFHVLQARGFIRATRIGSLGIEGEGKATTWTLTEWPAQNGHAATKDYLTWREGNDFDVQRGRPPRHAQKPVPLSRTPCPSGSDVVIVRTPRKGSPCPSGSDVERV